MLCFFNLSPGARHRLSKDHGVSVNEKVLDKSEARFVQVDCFRIAVTRAQSRKA